MTDPMLVRMRLDALVLDQHAQPRTGVDLAVVAEYAEDMRRGDEFPPVDAFGTTEQAYLASGWHRYYARKSAGSDDVAVLLHSGGLSDAVWFSCGTNTDHGLRRSNADKRRSVENALRHRPDLVDQAIAKHCGVDPKTVAAARLRLSLEIPQMTERTVERNGTTYTQDVSNIGRRPLPDYAAPGVPFVTPLVPEVPPEETAYYALSRQRLVVRLRPEAVASAAYDPDGALVGFEELHRWLGEMIVALRARVSAPVRAVK